MGNNVIPIPRTGIARALSKLGLCSRSQAALLVRAGRVTLNGQTVTDPEHPVRLNQDRVCLDGVAAQAVTRRYLMLNKPRGLVTTAHDEHGRATVYACLNATDITGLAPVGRLDKASEGLLLFSNDSAWAARVLSPASQLAKVYHVQLARHLSADEMAQLQHGVMMPDGTCLNAAAVRVLRAGTKTCWLEITLHEGKNRHIRRMLEGLGVAVQRLLRVAIGPVTLDDLAKGETRPLTAEEVAVLGGAKVG